MWLRKWRMSKVNRYGVSLLWDRKSKESSFVVMSVCVHPCCHVLFWTRREFNSCEDVVHSTRLDYPLSPLPSIISFFMYLHVCLCVCVILVDVLKCPTQGHCGSVGFYSDKWKVSSSCATRQVWSSAHLNSCQNPKWKQNNFLTSAGF